MTSKRRSSGTARRSAPRSSIARWSPATSVEEVLLAVSDSYIQLLTPTSDKSPVARFLERRGEGLHHVGYRVKDCAAALESVKATGAKMIDEVPRPGSRGTTVAFVHPKGAFGHPRRARRGVGTVGPL